MNISYYDFTNLPDDAQYDMVLNQGRMINENTISNTRYVLYELSFFSVEIIYSITKNRISGKNIFMNKSAYAV
ncbi:hypothetical protein [Chryseobacterium chendengshani]|uniref:hypothetical protein n=1 Tax=Chryseobacterium sp. LJ756 TaxID=2864113 RepID=UPI001C63D1E6|nr:hypothetical protein [Chryseobacterium sp. LJ756]MBW7674328.1 hypothetical protein [Chryseobacterium sp. LJ756]